MRKEIEIWWKQANDDYSTARFNFKGRKYRIASFLAQQASEKALKALLIKKKNQLIKTHDLVLLAKKVEALADIIKLCKELTPVYVETRYPSISEHGFKKITQKEAKKIFKNTVLAKDFDVVEI